MASLFQATRAAVRIVFDTMAYRLKKREAGNLVTSITLALALRLGAVDIALRLAFGVVLNVWVYLVNDCFDVRVDLDAPGRDSSRTRFLAENLRTGWAASIALGALLTLAGALHGMALLVAFVSTAVIIVAYSGWLKYRPIVDILAMFAWGISMGLVGMPLDSHVGWRLVGLLGVMCAATEALQVLRDEPSDRASDVRTTAVAFGVRATVVIARALMLASAAYASLLLHRWIGLGFVAAMFVPLRSGDEQRAWNLIKSLFGLVWLALLGAYYVQGRLDGWL